HVVAGLVEVLRQPRRSRARHRREPLRELGPGGFELLLLTVLGLPGTARIHLAHLAPPSLPLAGNRPYRGESGGMSSRAYAAGRRAPRRRVQRRAGPSRIRWDRVGRIALVLVLFGVMVSYLNPMVNLLEAWQGSKSSDQELAQLKQQKV